MSKKSSIERNEKRRRLSVKYAAKRAELKKVIANPRSSDDEFFTAMRTLDRLPKNSSKIRVRNRCSVTGRPRGYVGRFGISRIQVREMVASGLIPGVVKSSW